MPTTANALLEADTWKLTHRGNSADFGPSTISLLMTNQSDSIGFFDSEELEVVWADRFSNEIEKFEGNADRYWQLPDGDHACGAADLRDFLGCRADASDEVKAAARSRHAFRAFKKLAPSELVSAWEEFEDQQKLRGLLGFFRVHEVTVELPTKLRLVK